MAIFDSERDTALELIAENGKATKLRVFTSAVDPNEPFESANPTVQELEAPMVFLNFKSNANGETYFNGSLVHQGDKKVLLAAKGLAFDPNLNGEVERSDGTVWKIVNIKGLDPNEEKILFTMQVRQ